MANLIIKPSTGGQLIIKDEGGDAAITVGTGGDTTLAGTANNLGTVTAGTLGTAITGDAFKNGSCYFRSNFTTDSGWEQLNANVNVPFTAMPVDVDSCCSVSGSTVRFTVPADGVYVFWFSIYTAWNDSSNCFTFAIDDARTGTAQSHDFGSGSIDAISASDQSLTMTRVLELDAATYITVQASVASDYYAGHSSWGGCRIG